MRDLQATADRVEIEALRGEFTDAVMMRDYDRVASLFTPDGALRMPNVPAQLAGREQACGGRNTVTMLRQFPLVPGTWAWCAWASASACPLRRTAMACCLTFGMSRSASAGPCVRHKPPLSDG
jgi:hypothetical protein